jgi:hypothetical protein
MRRLMEMEARMWANLIRWVTRRPVCAPGEKAFGYASTITPVLLAFIGVSIVEIPILHLLLPSFLKLAGDVLSVYGLLWMVGLLAGLRIYPHVVGPAGLRVRNHTGLDLTVPWVYVASVAAVNRGLEAKGIQMDGSVLCFGVMKQTTVDVAFRHPTILELPTGDSEPVTGIRIAADRPAELVAAVRQYLSAVDTTKGRVGGAVPGRGGG